MLLFKKEERMKKLFYLLFLSFVLLKIDVYAYNNINVYVIDSSYQNHGGIIADIIKNQAPGANVCLLTISDSPYINALDAARAIRQAVDAGADIINISWGSNHYSQILADAINYALSKGVVVVAASGNEAKFRPSYPAALPGVIAVGAIEKNPFTGNWERAFYSNSADIYAPGSVNYNTHGTSFAAPYVAGQIARIMQEQGVSANKAKEILLAEARKNHNVVGATVEETKYTCFTPPEEILPDEEIFYELMRIVAYVDNLIREIFGLPPLLELPFSDDFSPFAEEIPFYGSPYMGENHLPPLF